MLTASLVAYDTTAINHGLRIRRNLLFIGFNATKLLIKGIDIV